LIVRFPNGSSAVTPCPRPASAAPPSEFLGSVKPGQMVVMEFIVIYNNLTTTTRTSYMMWYY
jgi:hypothetical protein